VAVHALAAGQDRTIHFDTAAGGHRARALVLSFSDHVRSGPKRRSFLLRETNLFSERDVLSPP
jgi:hypothetical protein